MAVKFINPKIQSLATLPEALLVGLSPLIAPVLSIFMSWNEAVILTEGMKEVYTFMESSSGYNAIFWATFLFYMAALFAAVNFPVVILNAVADKKISFVEVMMIFGFGLLAVSAHVYTLKISHVVFVTKMANVVGAQERYTMQLVYIFVILMLDIVAGLTAYFANQSKMKAAAPTPSSRTPAPAPASSPSPALPALPAPKTIDDVARWLFTNSGFLSSANVEPAHSGFQTYDAAKYKDIVGRFTSDPNKLYTYLSTLPSSDKLAIYQHIGIAKKDQVYFSKSAAVAANFR